MARRFQFRGERDGVTYVDDYAHLPGEVDADDPRRRAKAAGQRVVAVFQPHRYTRTAALWRDFADAFAGADAVVLTDVYRPASSRSPACRAGWSCARCSTRTPSSRSSTCRAAPTSSRTCRAWPDPATSC